MREPFITIDPAALRKPSAGTKPTISGPDIKLEMEGSALEYFGLPLEAAVGKIATLTYIEDLKWSKGLYSFTLKAGDKIRVAITDKPENIRFAPQLGYTEGNLGRSGAPGICYVNVNVDFDCDGVSGAENECGLFIAGSRASVSFSKPFDSSSLTKHSIQTALSEFVIPNPTLLNQMSSMSSLAFTVRGRIRFVADVAFSLDNVDFSAPSQELTDECLTLGVKILGPIPQNNRGLKASVDYTHADDFVLVIEKSDSMAVIHILYNPSHEDDNHRTDVRVEDVSVSLDSTQLSELLHAVTRSETLTEGILAAASQETSEFSTAAITRLTRWLSDPDNPDGLIAFLRQQKHYTTLFTLAVDLTHPELAQSMDAIFLGGVPDAIKTGAFIDHSERGVVEQLRQYSIIPIHIADMYLCSSQQDPFVGFSVELTNDGAIYIAPRNRGNSEHRSDPAVLGQDQSDNGPRTAHNPSNDDPTAPNSAHVYYATDRRQLVARGGDVQYGRERSPLGALYFGECYISIPDVHNVGHLESPSALRLEFRTDYKKHIALAKIIAQDELAFFQNVALSVAASTNKDIFVFVHGYNVTFADAARRTGQIAFDLGFCGAAIFYSWPSKGRLLEYLKDETNIRHSTSHFQQFLHLLFEHSKAERIHLVAHSMGTRAVFDSMISLMNDPNNQLRLGHLLLAAPDIDAETFQESGQTLQKCAGRVTVYESSNDKALKASKFFHGYPRAGEPVVIVPGLDTIDASDINTDFLGHSYFSNNWSLLSDIYHLLLHDQIPEHRFGLKEVQHELGRYYCFRR